MEIINKKDNSLIKKKGLALFLKREKITRIEPSAMSLIQREIIESLVNRIKKARENMIINGRKTLKEEDFYKSDKKEEYFEI